MKPVTDTCNQVWDYFSHTTVALNNPKQSCGRVAAAVKGPRLRCGSSVGNIPNSSGSSASVCTASEVKRMARDEIHVNKWASLFVSAAIWGMRSAGLHGCTLLFSSKTCMQQKCHSTEQLFLHQDPQRIMSDSWKWQKCSSWTISAH